MLLLSSVSISNPASGQVVGRKLDLHAIAWEDPDVVLSHLPGDRRENIVATLLKLYPKHGAGKRLDDLSLDLDLVLFGYLPASFTAQEKPRSVNAVERQRTQQGAARSRACRSW